MNETLGNISFDILETRAFRKCMVEIVEMLPMRDKQTTWKDRATLLLICESLSLAFFPSKVCILKSSYCCNGRADCDDASDEFPSLCGDEETSGEEEGREGITDPWWSTWDKAFLSPLGLD